MGGKTKRKKPRVTHRERAPSGQDPSTPSWLVYAERITISSSFNVPGRVYKRWSRTDQQVNDKAIYHYIPEMGLGWRRRADEFLMQVVTSRLMEGASRANLRREETS